MEMEDFFMGVAQSTSQAFTSVNNTQEKILNLASLTIRLRFAGKQMMPIILPAIEHLVEDIPSCSPIYLIDIWDSTSTSTDFPKSPCDKDAIKVRGELTGFLSDRFETAFFPHARMLTLLDHQQNYGIVCFVDSRDIPAFELACPLRGVFSWILRRNQMAMVHAAGVGSQDGCVLIGGNSGSGKSSTSLRALIGGMTYFGDDICAISFQDNVPKIHGIYSSGKVLSSNLHNFPSLKTSLHGHYEEEYEKEIFFFNQAFHSFLGKNGQLSAVIIPYQDSTIPIGFDQLPFANALSIICSSSKLLFPDAKNETFILLRAIFHHIPCFRFNLGPDPSRIASTLAAFISRLKTTSHQYEK